MDRVESRYQKNVESRLVQRVKKGQPIDQSRHDFGGPRPTSHKTLFCALHNSSETDRAPLPRSQSEEACCQIIPWSCSSCCQRYSLVWASRFLASSSANVQRCLTAAFACLGGIPRENGRGARATTASTLSTTTTIITTITTTNSWCQAVSGRTPRVLARDPWLGPAACR